MASQMKGGRRHLRVLQSVRIQIPPGWAPQGSALLSLISFILLGIVKDLPPGRPTPAPISLKTWVIPPSEGDITAGRILTPALSSCAASHFFLSDMLSESLLKVYRKPPPPPHTSEEQRFEGVWWWLMKEGG